MNADQKIDSYLASALALREGNPGSRWLTLLQGVLTGWSLWLVAVGCQSAVTPEPTPPQWFEDVTEKVGLDFVHDPGPVGEYQLPQIAGSGAAFLDFDGDGRLDIYLIHNGGPSGRRNQLFRQGPDGRFRDVSSGSGVDVAGWGMGAAVGDINNDGRPDLLVTEFGRLWLFLNNGNGTFSDITQAAGVNSLLWGTSAAFFDYNRDGWLDLVVVNYAQYDPSWPCFHPGGGRDFCTPTHFPEAVTRLYRHQGTEMPRFEDVTVSSGLARATAYGLGVYCADFDGDGWPDIFVASDQRPNRLWINQRDGTFKEDALVRGLAYNCLGKPQANMGIAIGDVDGNGLFDIFVTHLTDETHALWVQEPRGWFRDRTTAAGLASPRWPGTGWGTVLIDFDHDGALDLALVNGRVIRAREPVSGVPEPWAWYAERNQLFANDGTGIFRDASLENPAFCGIPGVYRGLAYADFDNDGAVDLLVTALAGRARLFRNVALKRGHWLRVRTVDRVLRRDAYGAEVTVRAGGRDRTQTVMPASSYLCSNDPWLHFGLGSAERIDAVVVHWPDGLIEEFPTLSSNQAVVLHRGEGRLTSSKQKKP